MCKYLIISDPDNTKADEEILRFLRRFHETFTTGFYYNFEAYGDAQACIWYLFDDNENMKEVFWKDSAFNLGKNKIMALDGFFSCNCSDGDLPMIEDVWEEVVGEIDYN